MNDTRTTPDAEGREKRAWQPPAIEELDFNATEAAYVPGTPIDLGIYTV